MAQSHQLHVAHETSNGIVYLFQRVTIRLLQKWDRSRIQSPCARKLSINLPSTSGAERNDPALFDIRSKGTTSHPFCGSRRIDEFTIALVQVFGGSYRRRVRI